MRSMMKPATVLATAAFSLLVLFCGGCDRGDGGKQAGNSAATSPTTNEAGGAGAPAGGVLAAGKIGVPLAAKETYKPVPGVYGGRLVRDTLGEPKSFNPIVA